MEDDIINSVIMNDVLNHLRSQPNDFGIGLDCTGDHGVQLKKEFRKNEQKNRQELYETRLAKYNKRINELQTQKVINNDKKVMESRQKEERVKNALLDLKLQDEGNRFKLINSIKSKGKKSQNLIVETKNQKIREKQNKDIIRYLDKVNHQNRKIVENRHLIEKCLEHVVQENDEELSVDHEEEMEEEKIEETQEEECVIDSDQSKLKVICEERESMIDHLQMYLQRIYMLKKNFCSCEAGRHFFLKTGPIWDSLTQCIYRKSEILREMNRNPEDNNMPEEYRRIYEPYDDMAALAYKRARGSQSIDTKFLKTLVADMDYEFNDKDIYNAVLKAKRLIGKSATALEILDLVKMILESEFDTNDSVWYIVSGLCRRTVFEYAKRRMSYRILAYSQNTIKRLQSLNNINLIPKRLLMAKNTSENHKIEPLVLAFLTDDVKYGYLNAEEHKMLTENVYRNEVEKRMQEFVNNNHKKEEDTDKIYQMPLKTLLINHADSQIDRLLAFVYKQIVPVLCKKSNNTMTLHLLEEKLTDGKFNILARKLTKMVFGMGGTYDEKIYVMEVIMEKIGIEITKRSPTVQYKSSKTVVAREKEVDFSYFRKKLGDLKTPKKPIKKK